MASRTIIQLTDDLDGTDGTQTVQFTVNGVDYELDVNDKNAEKFRKALEPYVSAARRATGRRPSPRGATAKANKEETQAIRQWAKESGYAVSDRGRISAEIRAAYHAAP